MIIICLILILGNHFDRYSSRAIELWNVASAGRASRQLPLIQTSLMWCMTTRGFTITASTHAGAADLLVRVGYWVRRRGCILVVLRAVWAVGTGAIWISDRICRVGGISHWDCGIPIGRNSNSSISIYCCCPSNCCHGCYIGDRLYQPVIPSIYRVLPGLAATHHY